MGVNLISFWLVCTYALRGVRVVSRTKSRNTNIATRNILPPVLRVQVLHGVFTENSGCGVVLYFGAANATVGRALPAGITPTQARRAAPALVAGADVVASTQSGTVPRVAMPMLLDFVRPTTRAEGPHRDTCGEGQTKLN